ncbi:MAG: VanR-ABDEGLN family response regulator transcription factor [[Clostridium] spiroforme]|uniref:VanR-ABDEGLN family response regulator transcription factor n=1 Tax=Thomasclavelia spiroformis TaxID=29348 RepID=A0A943EM01_9FIRM|nr:MULTISPECIES: VanR-ABDEGLN family response regulator transcription factor [Thomasclavelia]MBS5588856.1 VanR-ABDEGLN family response regulator transcription factor [Thomasclavelia spiroformis]
MAYKILVVDDEQSIADLVELYLQNENYHIFKHYCGKDALESLQKNLYDLAILDVMMPDLDGFSLLKEIRKHYYFPVIMLTAKSNDLDKINGLTLGADDYLTKPFNPLELAARVKTQLRRYLRYNQSPSTNQYIYDFNGLVINNNTHKCTLYDQQLNLTPIEFSILWYLCSKRGNVVTSEELFEAVWQEKYLDNNNTVMAHVARLREKMHENARKPKFIKTVWGVGYTIE